ncbi:hypothetical protein [Clostridium thailandense]
MAKFMRDLYRMPDKVEAVLDVIQKYTIESLRQQITQMKPDGTTDIYKIK